MIRRVRRRFGSSSPVAGGRSDIAWKAPTERRGETETNAGALVPGVLRLYMACRRCQRCYGNRLGPDSGDLLASPNRRFMSHPVAAEMPHPGRGFMPSQSAPFFPGPCIQDLSITRASRNDQRLAVFAIASAGWFAGIIGKKMKLLAILRAKNPDRLIRAGSHYILAIRTEAGGVYGPLMPQELRHQLRMRGQRRPGPYGLISARSQDGLPVDTEARRRDLRRMSTQQLQHPTIAHTP